MPIAVKISPVTTNPSNGRRPPVSLNLLQVSYEHSVLIPIGHVPFVSKQQLEELRTEHAGTHIFRRRDMFIENTPISGSVEPVGDCQMRPAGQVTQLVAGLLLEWLTEHFFAKRRRIFKKRDGRLILVGNRDRDNLLKAAYPNLPDWLSLRLAYQVGVRTEYPHGRPEVFLTIETVTRPLIELTVDQLLLHKVDPGGIYIMRRAGVEDERLGDPGRLTGRVTGVSGDLLELTDHDEGWASIPASDSKLEPRLEVLAKVIASLGYDNGDPSVVLHRIRQASHRVSNGRTRLERIRTLVSYLQSQEAVVAPTLHCRFQSLLDSRARFPPNFCAPRPVYIFDPGFRQAYRLSKRGLDKYGPYDKFQFSRKHLNIAVVCQADLQGRVEPFVRQMLHGSSTTRGDIGFLRRFSLCKPFIHVFQTKDESAQSYREASLAALEFIGEHDKKWDIVLVQTSESMEDLPESEDPYLVTKALFLSRETAIQHFHIETAQQEPYQRVYSLDNMGLACYAKLGGIPWLLPTDQKVAHELVIGIGSHQSCVSRFGVGDRYVGITTIFSGDGRYLLSGRTKAVPYEDYASALLESVKRAILQVRQEAGWAPEDPVRLIFHVFKPIKNTEATAVKSLVQELALPHAEFAFLHLAESHSYQLFDESQAGELVNNHRRGVFAPASGLVVKLSRETALVVLKGPRELKQATDGHPSPILLRLHRNSTFSDLTYLAMQVFTFSCQSWRSFLPAPMPITVGYSDLVARNLQRLGKVQGWDDSLLVGRIGRTPWFL